MQGLSRASEQINNRSAPFLYVYGKITTQINTPMKTGQDFYLSPNCEVVVLQIEGTIAQSPNYSGMGEEEDW